MRYIVHADVLSGSKTGETKAPAIHVQLMNYSHRSLMHAVATCKYMNYDDCTLDYCIGLGYCKSVYDK